MLLIWQVIFPRFWSLFFKKQKLSEKQNVEKQNQVDAEVLAEVVDQSLSLIQTLQEPGEIQPSNIIALNSLAGAITNVLALLRIHISSIAVTPTTLAASCVTMKRNSSKQPG